MAAFRAHEFEKEGSFRADEVKKGGFGGGGGGGAHTHTVLLLEYPPGL